MNKGRTSGVAAVAAVAAIVVGARGSRCESLLAVARWIGAKIESTGSAPTARTSLASPHGLTDKC